MSYADPGYIFFGMHNLSGAHFGPLSFVIRITMEEVTQRLDRLPLKRQQQFQRIVQKQLWFLSDTSEETRNAIIEASKAQILQYLAKEEAEKISPRRHGSKGKKHREKANYYIQRIEKKLENNAIHYPALFQELFNVTLREKHSAEGIGYIGLCPFHDEKTPSLSIKPRSWIAKCYGCGQGYEIINVVRNLLGLKYSRALWVLEKYICTPEETQERKKRDKMTQELFAAQKEQSNEKREFVRDMHIEAYPIPPYFPKKKFEAKFKQRKAERAQKEQEKGNPEDKFPF